MPYAPTTVDVSRLPAPDAIEPLSFDALLAAFIARFGTAWASARAVDSSLPDYDVQMLETDPAMVVGQAWSYLRLLDRARVNDAVRAVLAPLSKGADLDNVAASANVSRLVVIPADAQKGTPAVMEDDESLLRRYLLAFDRPSAGSPGRYLYDARTAWPLLGDVAVVGRAVHGRRGDTDVVVSGPGGRDPTDAEMAKVRSALTAPEVAPEAVSLVVRRADRVGYAVSLVIEIPPGPDAAIVRDDAIARVKAAAAARALIGAEIPAAYLAGAAYGANVIRVRDLAPVVVASNPYAVPVCASVSISVEVRQ